MEKRRRLSKKRNTLRADSEIHYPSEKRCSKCSTVKPAADFPKARAENDGLKSYCKGCGKKYRALWYVANRESEIANTLAYQRAHPDSTKRHAKATYERNIESRRARMNAAYAKVKDTPERKAANRVQYEKKSEKMSLDFCRRYADNPDRFKEYSRRYRKENRDKCTALSNAARVRKQNAAGSHTLAEWIEVLEYFNHCCAYCLRSDVECGKLTRDHLQPLKQGGSDYIDNIVPSCRRCNSSKNSRTLLTFTLRKTLLAA